MTIPEYLDAVKRTECDYQATRRWAGRERAMLPLMAGTPERDYRILHAVMGLCTETGELVEAVLKPRSEPLAQMDRIEELGDLAWYCAMLMDALGVYAVAEEPVEPGSIAWGLIVEIGALNDLVKRFLFYGTPFNLELARDRVSKIWNFLRELAQLQGYPMESVLARNAGKLHKRYPERFTEARAVHRDLAAERQALGQ